jgi:hypothetical protein
MERNLLFRDGPMRFQRPRTLRDMKYWRRMVEMRTPFSSETISLATPPSSSMRRDV